MSSADDVVRRQIMSNLVAAVHLLQGKSAVLNRLTYLGLRSEKALSG